MPHTFAAKCLSGSCIATTGKHVAWEAMDHLESPGNEPIGEVVMKKQKQVPTQTRSRGHHEKERYHVAIVSPGADRE